MVAYVPEIQPNTTADNPSNNPLDVSPEVPGSSDASENKKARSIWPLFQLWGFLKPYRLRIVAAGIALIAAAAATLTLPVAFRYMIDLGFSRNNAEQIDRYFLALFVVALILAAATALRYYLVSWIGERLVADVRSKVYSHVLQQSPVFFETTRTGEVLSRLTTDTTLIQSVIGSSVSVALRNTLLLVGGLTMLLITSLKLSSMILLLIPVVMVPLIVFGRRVRKLSRDSQDRIADSSAVAQEVLNAVSTVQAFGQQRHETGRFDSSVTASFETALRRITNRAALTAMVIMLVFGAVVLVLWIGAHAVLDGRMSAGELGQFLLYAVFTAGAVGALSESWGELQRAAGATERLTELLAANTQLPVAMPVATPGSDGTIQFSNLHFSYPSRPDVKVLNGINLTINPGETVALVGPSGAGKTTIFQLLLRFYDPQQGSLSVGGSDLRHCDPEAVRKQFALVPQESVIFAESALENIRYGNSSATDSDVINAAQHAAAADFLNAQPEGFDTFLGERGVRLSGGQKQRIAIARAMLKDAPVVLLDEATSALDAESEQLVQKALEELTENRTTLVIAHRLATVREADRIIVLDGGEIVAEGSHDELMQQQGLYARLAKLQFRDA